MKIGSKLTVVCLILFCCLLMMASTVYAKDSKLIPVFLSEDGSLLLVTDSSHDGLLLINTATGESTLVTQGINAGYYASISPDNKYVCYKLIQKIGGQLTQAPVLFDIKAKQNKQLWDFVPVAGTPAVSVIGKIAFTIGNELIILNPGFQVIATFDLGHHVNLLAFSPDGGSILYNDTKHQIVILNLADGSKEIITDGAKDYWGPSFSPSGTQILASGVDGDIVCASLGKKGQKSLGKGSNPVWLDDNTIAFVKKTPKDEKIVKTEIISISPCGAGGKSDLLQEGDVDAVLSKGGIAIGNNGKIGCGLLSKKLKDFELPGLGEESGDGGAAIQDVIINGNIVEITGVPYIHQAYDTLDTFCGSWACGATSALMAIQYYDILPENPYEVSYPYTHISPFGFYISEVYTFNGYTYDIEGRDSCHKKSYGGYAYIIQNNWEDTKGHMAEYISYHGPESSVDWSPTFAKAQYEVDIGCPYVLLNSLTSAGHYITGIGYYTDQYTLVFNDPYGDKNTPGYPSYDGTRVFYDWPGYNYGNENLVTVWCYIYCRIYSGPTPTPTPTPTPIDPGTDVIVDNDHGAPYYTETGTWTLSSYAGYNGGTYRYATCGATSTATWTAPLSESGYYEAFVIYVAGSNRASSAQYIVHASDGDHVVNINQQNNSLVWVSLGVYPFNAGDNSLTLNAEPSTPAGNVVIADAVRFTITGGPTPTPTPTPTPSGSVFVNDIAMSYGNTGRNYYGLATVWIKNNSGSDVSGATVYGEWTGSVSGSSNGDTLGDGKVTLQSPSKKDGGTFNFCVTDVVADGYIYDPGMNVETCDSITTP